MEDPILSHTLVKLFDAEDNMNEKVRTFDLPLEINIVTSRK